MKIASSNLEFASQHSASSNHTLNESLRAWVGPQRPDFEGNQRGAAQMATASVPAPVISDAAYAAQAADQNDQTKAVEDAADSVEHDPRLILIRHMVEMLTGQKVKVISAGNLQMSSTTVQMSQAAVQAVQQASSSSTSGRAGYGIEYDRHEVRTETELTSFQSAGIVRTSDGKEIKFQLSLNMARSFSEESNVSLRAGDGVRKDPLVINFNGTSAQLQSQRFSFDIDNNGSKEQVALLGGNSGYLALDLNHNGKIDSGVELFGTTSGDGFADLAKLDGDGNGWIDENDAAFNALRVWTPTADGGGQLATLKEKQVGALYLGKAATPFELKDGNNQSLGAVRTSGVYLTEAGNAGSLQQIDLTV